MFVPLLTRRSKDARLGRRKGGGRGGQKSGGGGKTSGGGGKTSGGGGKTSGGGGKTTTGSSTSGGGKKSAVPLSTSTANGKTSATAYGPGGGSTIVIPTGQFFGGRSAGGATRNQIFGSRTYGSGYPGISGRGVRGRGFPFWFWPVVWVVPGGIYLEASEYGDSYNTSRIGGPMTQATFISNSTNTAFYVLSDNSTVTSLISTIGINCSNSLSSSSSTTPQAYNGSAARAPQPEEAIQYYRASSIVLALDGYNNSATYSNDSNAADSPLPSGTDMTLLNCLNQTIGLSAPLVNGARTRWSTGPSSMSLWGLVCLVWWILSFR